MRDSDEVKLLKDEIAFRDQRIKELEADRATQETLIAEQKERERELREKLTRRVDLPKK